MANFIVTTALDLTGDGETVTGSLRAALEAANAAPGEDHLIDLSAIAGQTVRLSEAALTVNANVEITGAGVVITGDTEGNDALSVGPDGQSVTDAFANFNTDDNVRVFDILSGMVVLSDLTLTGGVAQVPNGDGNSDGSGGAISANGADVDLTLRDVTLMGNAANVDGGAVSATGAALRIEDSVLSANRAGLADGIRGTGGAVDANAALVIIGSVFADNAALTNGGAVNTSGTSSALGAADIVSSTFINNSAGDGGAIGNFGDLTLTNVTLADNAAVAQSFNGGQFTTGGRGGAIVNTRSLTLEQTTVTSNLANGDGGGIFSTGSATVAASNSIITGNTANSANGGAAAGNELFGSGATLTLTGVNLLGEAPADHGSPDLNGQIVLGDGNSLTLADVFSAIDTITGGGAVTAGDIPTVALNPDGPAVNAGLIAAIPPDRQDVDGDTNITEPLPQDTLGAARIQDGFPDLGAVEVSPAPVDDTPSLLVTTTLDVVDSTDGQISLREAVGYVNDGLLTGTITFDAGEGAAFENGGTIVLTEGTLRLTQDIGFDGDLDDDGVADVTISGDAAGNDATTTLAGGPTVSDARENRSAGASDDNVRLFTVAEGTATFDGLILTGGGVNGAQLDADGNAINVTITTESGASTFSANAVGGGAILVERDAAAQIDNSVIAGNLAATPTGFDALSGGGLSNFGSLTITASEITANLAEASGGGLFNGLGATLNVDMSTISGNSVTAGTPGTGDYAGGGLANDGTAEITESTISNNLVSGRTGSGGGVANGSNGTLTLTDVDVLDNTVAGNGLIAGGGIANFGSAEITGGEVARNFANDLSVDGGDPGASGYGGGLFNIAEATVTGTVFSQNRSTEIGGGVANVTQFDFVPGGPFPVAGFAFQRAGSLSTDVEIGTAAELDIDGATFFNNTAIDGAGLSNQGYAEITGSTFNANVADDSGGAVFSDWLTAISDETSAVSLRGGLATFISGSAFFGNEATDGGAIAVEGFGDTLVVDTILRDNAASGDGGAINVGVTNDLAALSLYQATLYGNTADGNGGAVAVGIGFGTGFQNRLYVDQSTIVSNSAGGAVGGVGFVDNNLPGINSGLTRSEIFLRNTLLVGNENGSDFNDFGREGTVFPDQSRVTLRDVNVIGATPEDFDAPGAATSAADLAKLFTLPDPSQFTEVFASVDAVENTILPDADGLIKLAPNANNPALDQVLNYELTELTAQESFLLPGNVPAQRDLVDDLVDTNADGDVDDARTQDAAGNARSVGAGGDLGATELQQTVTGTPVPFAENLPPDVLPDFYSVGQGEVLTVSAAQGFFANDFDREGDAFGQLTLGSPSNGTLTHLGNGAFTYTPDPIFAGTDTFSYSLGDDASTLPQQRTVVTIEVAAQNQQPFLADDNYLVAQGVATDVSALGGLLANDSDLEGDAFATLEIVTQPENGTVVLAPGLTGGFTYTPDDGFFGSDTFTYTVSDGVSTLTPRTADVTLIVLENGSPTAVDDDYEVVADTPLVVSGAEGVLANDTDPENDAIAEIIATNPQNGSVVFEAGVTGGFTYTPNTGFTGTDSFTYQISDGISAASSAATVTFTVSAAGVVEAGADPESHDLTQGDMLTGTPDELDGDTVEGFDDTTMLGYEGAAFERGDMEVTQGSAILDVDTDGDGTADTRTTLLGDFTDGDFMAVNQITQTVVTFEDFLIPLEDGRRVEVSDVNGVINQAFITAYEDTDFQVEVDASIGFASFENVLGVYEVTESNEIVDARLLSKNVKEDTGAPLIISDVDAGNSVGFFIVQDGADWADALLDSDEITFVDAGLSPATVDDGPAVRLAVNGAVADVNVFHSFDPDLNFDGVAHALSGVAPAGEALIVGFEDLTGGGDRDFEDVVFSVSLADEFAFL